MLTSLVKKHMWDSSNIEVRLAVVRVCYYCFLDPIYFFNPSINQLVNQHEICRAPLYDTSRSAAVSDFTSVIRIVLLLLVAIEHKRNAHIYEKLDLSGIPTNLCRFL